MGMGMGMGTDIRKPLILNGVGSPF